MDYKRKFIEYDLPLAEISEQSAREKNIRHGHPSTLHIWWARRPLSSSRTTALAALLDDPGEENPEKRKEIYELIKKIASWDAVKDGNDQNIKKAQSLIKEQFGDNLPKVLDPFAGGGSIPLEGMRLGFETFVSDYNPVAVFIEKATIEWPQKFSFKIKIPSDLVDESKDDDLFKTINEQKHAKILQYLVQRWANKIIDELKNEIEPYFPTETLENNNFIGGTIKNTDGWIPVGYLWARTIPCQNPSCDAVIPLIRQFWLSKKSNKKLAYKPVIDYSNKEVNFELLEGSRLKQTIAEGFEPNRGTISRANAKCLICDQITKAKQVRQLSREGKMGERLVVVVLNNPNEPGKRYRLANEKDIELIEQAEIQLSKKIENWQFLESPLPIEKIPVERKTGSSGFRILLYGFETWMDLFNKRQLLSLISFLEKIKNKRKEILKECNELKKYNENLDFDSNQLTKAVQSYLAILVDRLADYNSTLCRWNSAREVVGNTFGRQALPMMWDYFEIYPISGSTGDVNGALNWIMYFLDKNSFDSNSDVTILRQSATELEYEDNSLDAVITDPPYYDNVAYADLSEFFYVWLKRIVGDIYPDLFSTPLVPKDNEAILEPKRHGGKEKAINFFEEKLENSFHEMHRVIKPNGIAVIVYAHKTTEGWESMLTGLVNAGFIVTGSWPIHTEMKSRLVASRAATLASSIYMVCRKTEREEVGFWSDIQGQVKKRVEEKLEQFWNEGIAGGDFFISAIGPGMESFSQYKRVETYDGKEVPVSELLQYIRGICTDFLVHRLLRNASTESIDKEAQFYLTYRWTFLDNKVEYDDARKIASAEGIDLEKLAKGNGFVKKTTKYIRVNGPQKRNDLKPTKSMNMVDAMHLACKYWEKNRKEDLNRLLAETGYAQSNAFWQFCQAVAECFNNGNKEKQLLEGLLMGKENYEKAADNIPTQTELWDDEE